MKPYFAKYLPVEGEINPKDLVITPEGKVHKCLQVFESLPSKVELQDKKLWEETELKKVKLFLCSRDIQPDDLVLLSVRVDSVPKKLHPDDFERGKHLGCFKVIGEVSPKAIWVKEGDEFDEEDIVRVGTIAWGGWAIVGTPLCDILERDNSDYIEGCIIKCPTCKTFH